MAEAYIYILQLKDNKYYVGFSENLEDRIVSHFSGDGSEWTKRHVPEKIIDVRSGGKILEKMVTLEFMCKFGWQNVRGGPWTACDLKNSPVCLRKSNQQPINVFFADEKENANQPAIT